MLFNYKIFTSFIFCAVITQLECQICTKRVVVTRWQQQSYRYTYRETYHGQCWYGCIKTRIGNFVDNKVVPRKIVESRQICCNGYMDVSNTSESIQCDPICMPACRNGYCKKPGMCACNDGFAFNPESNNFCDPICVNGCLHGTCIAPNNCQCHNGYRRENEICKPICTESCSNGTCIAPDTCECLPGFRQSENNICKPYCSSGCTNGECISPEICSCKEGWLKNENNSCIPQCEIPCGNGTCVTPNVCECFSGYENDQSYDKTSKNSSCVPKCNNCVNGSCAAPNECTCEPPFVAKSLSKSGRECDCKSECSNSSIKCEATVCVEVGSELLTTSWYSTTNSITTELSTTYGKDVSSESTTIISTTPITNLIVSSKEVSQSTESNTAHKLKSTKQSTPLTESTLSAAEATNDFHNDAFLINNTNKYNMSIKHENNEKVSKVWIYLSIIISVLVALLLIIIVVKRKSIAKWFKGGSYVVEDDKSKDISSPSQKMDMSYKYIMNKKKYEYT